MNEKQRAAHTDAQTSITPDCARAGDLVAYLYGEATPDEAQSFGQHLSACARCRDEMTAFGGVRESVGAWRAEAFSVAPATVFQPSTAKTGEDATTVLRHDTAADRKPSALAALREFFTLSPAWLRAASVAALLSIVSLAALTLARAEMRWDVDGVALRLGVPERVVKEVVKETVDVPSADSVSQEEVNAMVAAHRRELDALRSQLQQQATNEDYVNVNATASERRAASRVAANERATKRPSRSKPASRVARDAAGNDEDLPRLYDLLSEVN